MSRAVRLFSEKGFHQTSVQEIAQAVNISKGAFYKYYESKEGLLIEILKLHYENMIKQANEMNNMEGIPKREALVKKLENELEQWINHRDFFTVLFKDFPPSKNEKVSEIMKNLKSSMIELHKEALFDRYGNEIEPFISDMVIMLEGILKEYILTVILKQKDVDIERLARFIVSSFDAIVKSLPDMEPVLTDDRGGDKSINFVERMKNCFLIMEEKLKGLDIQDAKKEKLLESLGLLQAEFKKEEPKPFLMEALITYLKQEPFIVEEVLLLERLYTKLHDQ